MKNQFDKVPGIVIRDPSLRRRLGTEAARTAREGFSIESAVSSTAQLSEKFLNMRSTSPPRA